MTTLPGTVRRLLADAGLDAGLPSSVVTVSHGGGRVRLIAASGGERALQFAVDVLRIYGYTLTPGAEPWYYTVTKEIAP